VRPAIAVQMLSATGYTMADLVRDVVHQRFRGWFAARGPRHLGSLRIAKDDVRAVQVSARKDRVRAKDHAVSRVARQLHVRDT
jgi:hypothetical protein